VRHLRRTALVLSSVAAALAIVAASASAEVKVSALKPFNDTVSASSSPILIAGVLSCTINPGGFVDPKEAGTSGVVTATFTTRPTIEDCPAGWSAETSGTWTLSAEYETGKVTINIPPGGFYVFNTARTTIYANTGEEWKLNGVWNNGFPSPVSVPSTIYLFAGTHRNHGNVGQSPEMSIGSAFTTLTDVTQLSSLPLLLN
jgi:hypothetical protein